jgi:hypothetical protein
MQINSDPAVGHVPSPLLGAFLDSTLDPGGPHKQSRSYAPTWPKRIVHGWKLTIEQEHLFRVTILLRQLCNDLPNPIQEDWRVLAFNGGPGREPHDSCSRILAYQDH